MPLRPASLLLLGAALGVFVPESCCGCPSHSLRYYYMKVSEPSQEQPQIFIRGYLDDQPIVHFGSLTWRVEALVPWMEKTEKVTFLALNWVFTADLNHPTEGLHTWQAILGCELREGGSKGGFFRYGYDGTDFISLKNETFSWVAAQPQAEKIKQTLEDNPQWSRRIKDYLEKTCIEWLQRYLSYRNKTLDYTEHPKGKLTLKVVNDNLEVLICQGFGFYPKKIQATWMRDGEVCQNETLHRNMTPNSDGTYYVRLSIEIDPKERHHFQCYLNCEGLPEPLILALKEETGWQIPVGIVTGVLILGAVILFLKCKYRRGGNQKAKSSLEDSPSEILCHPPTSGREERERLLNSSPQSEIPLEDRASYGGWSSQRALKDSGSTLRRREGKQQLLQRPKSWTGEFKVLDKAGGTESEKMEQEWRKAEYVRLLESHTIPKYRGKKDSSSESWS